VKGYAAQKGGAPLVEYVFDAPELKAHHVEVKIKACGVCRSDVDAVSGMYDSLGLYQYPLVTGHEGVGEIVALGKDVHHLTKGQLVGLGVFRNSCEHCKYCLTGKNNICTAAEMMFAATNKGCLAEYVRINSKFAFPIPSGIAVEHAGPLMCAGTTTFAPFREYNIKPGDHVGVVGIGGLGHLALQFAKAFGCEVWAFSSSADKEAEAKGFGSHHFINTTVESSSKGAVGKLDFLLMTAGGSRGISWPYLLSTLAPNGTLVVMGAASHDDIPVSVFPFVFGQKRLVGSAAGSSALTADMLHFSALHKIKPVIEIFPTSKINEAFDRVRSGKVRYRAVVQFGH